MFTFIWIEKRSFGRSKTVKNERKKTETDKGKEKNEKEMNEE